MVLVNFGEHLEDLELTHSDKTNWGMQGGISPKVWSILKIRLLLVLIFFLSLSPFILFSFLLIFLDSYCPNVG